MLKQIPKLRWWIAGLLATASALAYVDRQTLPVVIGEIQKTIPITDQQYGNLQFMFLLAYGVMYIVGGKLTDILGARWGYFVIIVWWSAANLMQGEVSSVFGLGVGLFLLGFGEGGAFPAAAKAISEWFSAKERSLAFGIFNAGSGFGATIAPPLIAAIVLRLNWRWVFFITGASGFVWAVCWLELYYPPARHKRLTDPERDFLAEMIPAKAASSRLSWTDLFRLRQVWGLVAARFCSDAAWFFLIFWLPKYLADVRHLNIKSIGYFAWIPYALASLGSLLGGWLSSYLIKRRLSVDASRKICLGISAACMPLSLLITVSPLSVTIAFFSLAMLGHQCWSTIMQTLNADMFPSASVGSIAGLVGAAGAFGGMLFNVFAGALLTAYHSYAIIFAITGLLHPLGFVIILLVVRKIKPVTSHVIYKTTEAPI
ncbi:MAG TPA: MFS transporter [Candidatus Sulfotelmatobacter sp.]|nr:MFS transporter [Candidatus Sulfotelmatobacter sp.]